MTRISLRLCAIAALVASTWTAEASVAGDIDAGLTATSWHLVTLGNAPVAAGKPFLHLGADGSLSGSTGCNALKAGYAAGASSLLFGPIGTTRKYCRSAFETEQAFLAMLGKVRGYAIADGVLVLSGGNGEMLAVLKPADR